VVSPDLTLYYQVLYITLIIGLKCDLSKISEAEVTIDNIKFSCPEGFTIQTVSGYLTARLRQPDQGMAGGFVILPGKNIVSAQRPLYDHISEIASNNGVKKGQAYDRPR
jgi:hypothetical protein